MQMAIMVSFNSFYYNGYYQTIDAFFQILRKVTISETLFATRQELLLDLIRNWS